MTRTRVELVREGKYAAEVSIELIEEEGGWSPYLSLDDARKLDSVKLAKELSKRATGRTLYILDEPTTGLHFHDVAKLLEVLHELVSQGNTVVVIEHNLEVIKTADWVIDLGPEGGDGGGEIVAWGPPEDIVKAPRSYTGKFLAPVLKKADGKPRKSAGASEAAE